MEAPPEQEQADEGGLPADIPVTVQIGESEPQVIGTVGVVFRMSEPDEDGVSTATPVDPDDVGRQIAQLLEHAARELRDDHGEDPPEQ